MPTQAHHRQRPRHDEAKELLGSMFLMGFEGTTVTPHIRILIEDYRLGAVLLNAGNFVSAGQAITLIRDLQIIAHEARHPHPLLIAVDQENGLVKSVSDPDWVTQFPSSLGIAATGSTSSAYQVALMTARELSCLGVNWILGPALDVILDRSVPGFGSRSFGDDPEVVAKMGTAFIRGLKDGGVASLAKHFPLGGSLKFDESSTTVPIISETLEQIRHKVLVPFREAIKEKVPSIMSCGIAISSLGPGLLHACFSRKIVTELLREQLGFEGVVVSECLEMTSIAPNMGVGQATIMGIRAGCDILTICRSLSLQVEAFASLSLALENGSLLWDSIRKGAGRVMRLRAAHTSWSRALSPAGLEQMVPDRPGHLTLATRVYEESMTLVQDNAGNIPLTKVLSDSSTVLVLSPLLVHRASQGASGTTICSPQSVARETSNAALQKGEDYFQNFGLALACYEVGQVLHTSYTSHGVREEHEKLIDGADAIIIFVADALRNQYQIAFAKHVAAICKLGAANNNRPKRLILVSVSSPFDFPADTGWFGTLLCAYDSSVIALHCLARVLGGDITPTGRLPRLGGVAREPKPADASHHQTWLVEQLDWAKDRPWLIKFFKEATAEENPDETSLREDLYTHLLSCLEKLPRTFEGKQAVDFQGFVIRNTSTRVIYSFASALYWPHLQRGFLGDLLVHPGRRGLSMGRDLCTSVTKYITQRYHVNRIQFGCPILATTPGVPLPEDPGSLSNLGFFKALKLLSGWDIAPNAKTPRLASFRNENLNSTYDHFVQRGWTGRSSAETFIIERTQSTRCHGEILELAGEITATEAKNYWIPSLINRDLSSGNQESMMPEENLEIVEQSGLIATMAESGRAVAFLPLVTRDCPLARYIPSLLALPTSKLALLCPIISQSALPEAHSRKDCLRRLVVAAVGDAMQQRVETLVAHAIPTSDLFAEVLMETGFEREATFAVLDKALGDKWH